MFRYSIIVAFILTLVLVDGSALRAQAPTANAGSFRAFVSIDPSKATATVPSTAFGMFLGAWDRHILDPDIIPLYKATGITLLRYPGGSYADNFHWSTYKGSPYPTPQATPSLWLPPGVDFGHFAQFVDKLGGTAMITVDYGANMQGTGGGEPKEAAAWVAYANGSPGSDQVIGVDSSGNDWKTVGYWASLRASDPLPKDDGLNLLRIAHPRPLGYRLWEIGNELYGNGSFYPPGWETDYHAPYDSDRQGNPKLDGAAYGTNCRAFVAAMKAVDPTIKIGVTLVTQPWDEHDFSGWNSGVLGACGGLIDFVIIHEYSSAMTADRKYRVESDVLAKAGRIDQCVAAMRAQIKQYCGAHAKDVSLCVTETTGGPVENKMVIALFAAEIFPAFIENGASNVDWLDVHADYLTKQEKPDDAYYAIQMAHLLERPGDSTLKAASNNPLVSIHAARHADGRLGVMLINKSPDRYAKVEVTLPSAHPLSGTVATLSTTTGPPSTKPVSRLPARFDIVVPPYSVDLYTLH